MKVLKIVHDNISSMCLAFSVLSLISSYLLLSGNLAVICSYLTNSLSFPYNCVFSFACGFAVAIILFTIVIVIVEYAYIWRLTHNKVE